MTENKRVVPGGLNVANRVFADLVGYTAMECYGIVGMAAPDIKDGIVKLLPKDRFRRGIQVTTAEDGISVDLYVIVEQGTNLHAVSENLVDRVRFTLERYAEVPVKDVVAHIQGVKVRD